MIDKMLDFMYDHEDTIVWSMVSFVLGMLFAISALS